MMMLSRLTTFSVVAAASAVVVATTVALLRSPPAALPDRLKKIADDAVHIDNDGIYTELDWWHAYNPLYMANAARVPFFLDQIRRHYEMKDGLTDIKILDVGCGGGLVTEAMASRCNASIVGLDLSRESIRKAEAHSPFPSSRLQYVVGSAYQLPFEDKTIDAVVCSDVFEHLHDLQIALNEIARVLRPNGILVYDTINRTPASWYVTIVVAQDLLNYIPDHAHDWRLYITPTEMATAASRAGLVHAPAKDVLGMRPTINWPWAIIYRLWHGAGMWSLLDHWVLNQSTEISYLSFCVKPQ